MTPFNSGNSLVYYYYSRDSVPGTINLISPNCDYINNDICQIKDNALLIKKMGKYRLFINAHLFAGGLRGIQHAR